jgi:hypothetical protein
MESATAMMAKARMPPRARQGWRLTHSQSDSIAINESTPRSAAPHFNGLSDEIAVKAKRRAACGTHRSQKIS